MIQFIPLSCMHACRHSCLQLYAQEVVCVRLMVDTVSAGSGSGLAEQNLGNRWMLVHVPFRVTYTESDLSTVASSWWNRKHVILRFVFRSPMMNWTRMQFGIKTWITLLCSCQNKARLLSTEARLRTKEISHIYTPSDFKMNLNRNHQLHFFVCCLVNVVIYPTECLYSKGILLGGGVSDIIHHVKHLPELEDILCLGKTWLICRVQRAQKPLQTGNKLL